LKYPLKVLFYVVIPTVIERAMVLVQVLPCAEMLIHLSLLFLRKEGLSI